MTVRLDPARTGFENPTDEQFITKSKHTNPHKSTNGANLAKDMRNIENSSVETIWYTLLGNIIEALRRTKVQVIVQGSICNVFVAERIQLAELQSRSGAILHGGSGRCCTLQYVATSQSLLEDAALHCCQSPPRCATCTCIAPSHSGTPSPSPGLFTYIYATHINYCLRFTLVTRNGCKQWLPPVRLELNV